MAAIICVNLFPGCATHIELDEKLIVQTVGIDCEEDEYTVTLQFFTQSTPSSDSGGNPPVYTISGKAKTLPEAVIRAEINSGRTVMFGECQMLILGKDLNGSRFCDTIEITMNQYESHPKIYIVASKDKASDVLAVKYKEGSVSNYTTKRIIESSSEQGRSSLPMLFTVMREFRTTLECGFLPQLEIVGGEKNGKSNEAQDNTSEAQDNKPNEKPKDSENSEKEAKTESPAQNADNANSKESGPESGNESGNESGESDMTEDGRSIAFAGGILLKRAKYLATVNQETSAGIQWLKSNGINSKIMVNKEDVKDGMRETKEMVVGLYNLKTTLRTKLDEDGNLVLKVNCKTKAEYIQDRVTAETLKEDEKIDELTEKAIVKKLDDAFREVVNVHSCDCLNLEAIFRREHYDVWESRVKDNPDNWEKMLSEAKAEITADVTVNRYGITW
ncbi:hypothetical protein FACS189499_05240 [Clostridia bacterium]|nr:hypothetical protein FACS189499_05240 [Clostridia bacterium]